MNALNWLLFQSVSLSTYDEETTVSNSQYFLKIFLLINMDFFPVVGPEETMSMLVLSGQPSIFCIDLLCRVYLHILLEYT